MAVVLAWNVGGRYFRVAKVQVAVRAVIVRDIIYSVQHQSVTKVALTPRFCNNNSVFEKS